MRHQKLLRTLSSFWVVILLVGCLNKPPATPEPEGAPSPIPPTIGIAPTADKFSPTVVTEQPLSDATLTPPANPLQTVPGIELDSINSSALDLVVQAGAYWVRRNALQWSMIEPAEGDRNWEAASALEAELEAASKKGLQMILIVNSTPGWAQKTPGFFCGPVAPEKLAAFSRFLADAVKRYSAPPYNVKYWELGNEPDIDPSFVPPDSLYGCWGDKTDVFYGGGYYAEMLKQVYPQIKAANSQAQVLVGGLLMDCDPVAPPEGKDCTPSLFLEGILRSGGGDFFDGVSFHAYDYYDSAFEYGNPNWNSNWDSTGPVVIAKARYIRSLLVAYQQPDKLLMNTEAGLICAKTDDDPVCLSEEFGLTKSYYIAQLNTTALAEGLNANIWYSLTGWRGTGLVDPSGKPIPAFDAFRENAAVLDGATSIRAVNDIEGIRGFELIRPGERVWILWSIDGKEHLTDLKEKPASVWNVFGNPLEAGGQITIARRPVYILWQTTGG